MIHPSLVLIALLLAQSAAPLGRGAVAGRILQQDGRAAADVRVTVVASDTVNESMVLLSQTRTDANGQYRLEDLPAGCCLIAAGPLGALTYFPGVATPDESQVITVTDKSFQDRRDFRLLLANPTTQLIVPQTLTVATPSIVSGRFVVEGGGPMPRNVILKHSTAGASFAQKLTETPLIGDANGAFQTTITGINGGRMVLQSAEPSAYSVTSVMFGPDDASSHRATVIVGRPLVVTFKSIGVTVAGRIPDGASPSADGRKVTLAGTTSVPGTFPMTVSREANIGPDGNFTFSDVFRGAYEIRIAGTPGALGTPVDVMDRDVINVSVIPPK